MFDKLIKALITVSGCIAGYCLGTLVYILAVSTYAKGEAMDNGPAETFVPVIFAVMGGVLFFLLYRGVKDNWINIGNRIENDISKVPPIVFVGGVLGLLMGLLIAFLCSGIFSHIDILYLGQALTALCYIVFGGLGTVVGSRLAKRRIDKDSSDDRKTSFLVSIFGRGKSGKNEKQEAMPKILDTSVLIDGRIMDVMKTGFIEGKIIIPEFVLTELRHLSDSADVLKKAKGRRGLAILKEMQTYYGLEIYNTYADKDWEGAEEVDVKLLKLSQKLGGKIVTNDYNLIQVAEIQQIRVLNINDVVKALKPVVIPGEALDIQVVREGRENNQGVGYLDDGTMIIIENGKFLIGQMIKAEVTSILQTASGRMIFAKQKK